MSDRIAVFNEGKIEQIGRPAEVYEHPASEFVAGFVGVSNVLERDGRRFTVRPEKIRLLDDGRAAGAGAHVEEGTIRGVSLRGPVTRFHVELDAGGELQVVRQNLERPRARCSSNRDAMCGCAGGPSTIRHRKREEGGMID